MSHIHLLELRLANRRWPELALSALIILTVCSVTDASAAEAVSAAAQIAVMENTLTGASKAGLPLLSRMDALETLIYGHPTAGPLKERISQLNEYLGKEDKVDSPAQSAALKSETEKNPGKGFKQIANSKNSKVQALKTSSVSASRAVMQKSERGNTEKMLAKGASAAKSVSPQAQAAPKIKNDKLQANLLSPENHGDKSAENGASEEKRLLNTGSSSEADSMQSKSADNPSEDEPPIKYPPNLQKLMVEAMGFYRSGKTEEAKTSFEHIFSLYPDCVDACFNLGSLAEKRGDTEAAIIYYSHAQQIEPADEQIRAALFRLTGNDLTASGPAAAPATADPDFGFGMPPSQDNSAQNTPVVGANQYPASRSQAVQNALSTGKSILNFTLNRALSSMRYF